MENGSDLIGQLGGLGCDTQNALGRFMNNRDMYLKFLNMFTEEKSFDLLGKYIAEGNVKEAFACAHTIKGVSANLSLGPINRAVVPMVEKMRRGDLSGADADYEDLMGIYREIRDLILASQSAPEAL